MTVQDSSSQSAWSSTSSSSSTQDSTAALVALMRELNLASLASSEQLQDLSLALDQARQGLVKQLAQQSKEITAAQLLPWGPVAVSKLAAFFKRHVASGSREPMVQVPVHADAGVGVAFPSPLVARLAQEDEVYMTVAALNASLPDSVLLAQAIELHTPAGQLGLEGLDAPVTFSLPLNHSASLLCGYYDEEALAWSLKGTAVSGASGPSGLLLCETWHLSIFGAILKGVTATLACSNFGIFSEGALSLFLEGAWARRRGGIATWLLLAVLLLAYALAVCQDRKFAQAWSVEFLLVAADRTEVPAAEDEVRALPWLSGLFVGGLQLLRESGALREALDDVVSNWFEQFSELRNLLESVWDAMELEGGAVSLCGRCRALGNQALASSLAMTSRRVVGTQLRMSDETICFLMEDDDFLGFLADRYDESVREAAAGPGAVLEHDEFSSFQPEAWKAHAKARGSFAARQRKAWALLHREVRDAMERGAYGQERRQPLLSSLSIFLQHSPLCAVFSFDLFQSCQERVALMAAEALGALALSCGFFEAGGLVRKRLASGGSCGDEEGSDSWGFKLGRFATIATASYLVAGLPAFVLSTLNTRGGIVKLGKRNSPEWKRQLRSWRTQHCLVLAFALLYCCLCLCYMLLFLANLTEEDDADWSLAGILALCQDFLLVPFVIAVVVPGLVAAMVHVYRLKGGTNAELQRRVGERLQERGMLPITHV